MTTKSTSQQNSSDKQNQSQNQPSNSSTSSRGTQGGSHEQHVKAGQQSHKDTEEGKRSTRGNSEDQE